MLKELTKEIDQYLIKTNQTKTAFGLEVANDGHLYKRVATGQISVKNAEKVLAHIKQQSESPQS